MRSLRRKFSAFTLEYSFPGLASLAAAFLAIVVYYFKIDLPDLISTFKTPIIAIGTLLVIAFFVNNIGTLLVESKRRTFAGMKVDFKPREEAEKISFEDVDPVKLFNISRQRLIEDSARIDSISRRNLMFGIFFSALALTFIAWPLVSQTMSGATAVTDEKSAIAWVVQYYVPRFAVGVLLQFVGFFFLRLYVANELDLKHNKNEITNVELKMMGFELAKFFGDAASKKEAVKSFAQTERNFILKKNEKSVSTESLSEYNDIKAILEKLVDKIPSTKR